MRLFMVSTTAKKLQLKQELNIVRQAIHVKINDKEMVKSYLRGLAQKYGDLRTTITTRETPPTFLDLQFMLLTEENHVQEKKGVVHELRVSFEESR